MGCIFAETVLRRPGRDVVDQLTRITDMLGKPSDRIENDCMWTIAREVTYSMDFDNQSDT